MDAPGDESGSGAGVSERGRLIRIGGRDMIDWPAIVMRYGYAPGVIPSRPWWTDPYAPVLQKPEYDYGDVMRTSGAGVRGLWV